MEKTTESKKMKIFNKHYVIAFWATLVVAAGLIIGGFFMPPQGEVDGSVLTAVGEMFLWPALAFGAKALEDGKTAKFQKGDTSILVGKADDNLDED